MNLHHAQNTSIALDRADAHVAVTGGAQTGAYGANDRKVPSDAQAQAGTYKMGRTTVHGLRIAIEQPQGSFRTGMDKGGKAWSSRMAAHYGYFERTVGADGDGIDCFVGPFPESENVFVINQRSKGGGFDEHKVMVGFMHERHARGAYLDSYERGWSGLQSLVPLSINQLRWWIKHGNKRLALTAESLPLEGKKPMNPKISWTEAQPDSVSFDQVLYELRRMDGADGLLLDSVTMAEIMEDSDGVIAFDALVVENAQLSRLADRLRAIMDRSGGTVKAPAVQVSEPFRARGVTNIATVFELSDGQTVSVFFHNPDTAPNKLAPGDEMISWKWLLNKKDITIVVAPEKGLDLNPRVVAQRIMRLAEKNSPAFQKANAKRSERLGNIQAIRDRIAEKEATLTELVAQVEAARLEKSQKTMQQEDANAATREEVKQWLDGAGYAVKDAAMSQYTKTIGERVMFVTAAKLMLSAMLLDATKLGSAALNPIAPDFKDALIPTSDGATQPAMGYAAGLEALKGFVEGREREGVTVLPAGEQEPSPIALVDAAYQFANATDAFKIRVAGSIDKTDYSEFASAKAMDMKAVSLGAAIHWGMGAALDGVSVAELGHAPAYTDGTGKWHSYTMEAMKYKDDAALRYIIKDATEAAEAGEKMGNPKAAQYRDEAHYASMEMQRRRKGGSQIMDSAEGWDGIALDDAQDFSRSSIVGKIMKGGQQMGRAVIGGDGKAMVFVGASDDQRVQYWSTWSNSMENAMWSEDDGHLMVEKLLVPNVPSVAEPEPVEVYAFKDASAEAMGLFRIGAQNTAPYGTYKTAVSLEQSAVSHGMAVRWEAVSALPTFDDATGGLFGDGDSGFIRGDLAYNGTKLARVFLRDDGLVAFDYDAGLHKAIGSDFNKFEDDYSGWTDAWADVMFELKTACDSNGYAQKPASEILSDLLVSKGFTKNGTVFIHGDVMVSLHDRSATNEKSFAQMSVRDAGAWVPPSQDLDDFVYGDRLYWETWSDDEMNAEASTIEENAKVLQAWADGNKGGAEPTPEPAQAAPADNELTRLNAALKAAPKGREAVTSDDPEAIDKLERKLYALQLRQEFMKKTNKLIKKGDTAGLIAMGFNQTTIETMKQPDFAGRIGFPDYELTNNNGVISATRKRLEELRRNGFEAATPEPTVTPEPTPAPADSKTEDRAFFMSVIDGTNPDILEPELSSLIEAAYTRNSADAEMISLFSQAVNAYTQAMLNATAGV